MAVSFSKFANNPFFIFCKRVFVLIALNFIFCLMSILSCMVLFVPGLVSLHAVCYEMIHNIDEHSFKSFFVNIKDQWSFSWRFEILVMSVLLIAGAVYYFDYLYLTNISYDLFVWFSLIFISVVLLAGITLFFNVMTYNSYLKDDTFWMMIRKSSLITAKHIWHSLLMLVFFAAIVVVCYIVPYIIPFLPFSATAILCEGFNRKMFTQIAREEEERMLKEENLFLPVAVKEEEK